MQISELLENAVYAPSGDNCQPWKFVKEENLLHIHNDPQKDTSLYNFRQRASLIAHGALLENISIISKSMQYEAKIDLFPTPESSEKIATIRFKETNQPEDSLYKWIKHRTTNRKKYTTIPLTEKQKKILTSASEPFPSINIYLNTEAIPSLAKILANNDRMVFENYYLHNFLFNNIRCRYNESY